MQAKKDEGPCGWAAAKDQHGSQQIEQSENYFLFSGKVFVRQQPKQENHAEKGKDITSMISMPEDAYPRADKWLTLHNTHEREI